MRKKSYNNPVGFIFRAFAETRISAIDLSDLRSIIQRCGTKDGKKNREKNEFKSKICVCVCVYIMEELEKTVDDALHSTPRQPATCCSL